MFRNAAIVLGALWLVQCQPLETSKFGVRRNLNGRNRSNSPAKQNATFAWANWNKLLEIAKEIPHNVDEDNEHYFPATVKVDCSLISEIWICKVNGSESNIVPIPAHAETIEAMEIVKIAEQYKNDDKTRSETLLAFLKDLAERRAKNKTSYIEERKTPLVEPVGDSNDSKNLERAPRDVRPNDNDVERKINETVDIMIDLLEKINRAFGKKFLVNGTKNAKSHDGTSSNDSNHDPEIVISMDIESTKANEQAMRVLDVLEDIERVLKKNPVGKCLSDGARWKICGKNREDGPNVRQI